jgi:hypothetical protein
VLPRLVALFLVELLLAVGFFLRVERGIAGSVGVDADLARAREAARPDTGSLSGGPIGLRGPTIRWFRSSKSGFFEDFAARRVERTARPILRAFAACVPSGFRGVSAIRILLVLENEVTWF